MSENNQVKAQMQKAAAHIKAQEYDEAIAILVTIDHPTADKWRERAESALAARSRQRKKSRGKLLKRIVGGIIILIFLCAVLFLWQTWGWYFGTEQEELAAEFFCISRDVYYDEPCDAEYLAETHMDALTYCYDIHGFPSGQYSGWSVCLEGQGVTKYVP